jgi:hypothetical protein
MRNHIRRLVSVLVSVSMLALVLACLSARGATANALWSSPSQVDAQSSLNSVSCPTTRFCAAVDDAGNALTYNGTSWSSPSAIDAAHPLLTPPPSPPSHPPRARPREVPR